MVSESVSKGKSPAVGRRAFLQSLGGGLVLLLSLGEESGAQESGAGGHHRGGEQIPSDVAAWIHIAPDGRITAYTGKVEVGQNIRTSLTQAVADELRCSAGRVQLIMGDTDRTPWDAGTFGSRTTPTMAPQLRRMAATARERLVEAAAEQWSVDAKSLRVVNGAVQNPASGASLEFGPLAAHINWVQVIGVKDGITPATEWTAAGISEPKVNGRDIVTGRHQYTSDHKVHGLGYGFVLRAPSFGAKLETVDTKAASGMPGVTVVHDGDFVGVVASNEQTGKKALAAIRATWREKDQPVSDKNLFTNLKQEAEKTRSGAGAMKTPASGDKQVNSSYSVAYIAHVPLEPRAAVAQWSDAALTVWTGTQRPFGVRGELASAFAIPESQVRVIVPDTGSAYGGKHTGECAVEAARLAKAAGRPVKLIWGREEEFTWAYFRPAGLIEISSAVSPEGKLSAWSFHNYLSGGSGLQTPYEVPDPDVQFHEVDGPLRDGSYRGLAATANHFARESHMDEMAHAIGQDPLAFRMANLKNERMRAVLKAATDTFGWSDCKPSATRGYGLACGTEKGGYVASCVEIAISPKRELRVVRVVEAWECGAIVNPEHLRNQVEGAVVMGLGGALFEAIHFANGKISNPRLSAYRVPRFRDLPKIEVVLLDRKDLPSAGAGETPIVTVAPAIGNAVFSATGKRLRSLPMLPSLQA